MWGGVEKVVIGSIKVLIGAWLIKKGGPYF